ncbi:YlmC/YmxH family sporulation protein [Calderihabitans maritimus]|uniref:YlmC/YmxH family sporulation protein n=1 Tax=Calderihabitans maritimus TaxID=1246530 RepID=A0A1Z5HQE2_9FIRM|nr:YlmC/YmxH family sporulation protein [Calderihabitans maritimus]GAW91734.1 YlmC/YmxH family sporulation protein [Calderihabitans maritimus]
MKLSELIGKQIVNLYNGVNLGTVGESDLVIDTESGEVESIILPRKSNLISFWFNEQKLVIPWQAVKKVGSEVIIVDLDQSYSSLRKHSG